MLLSRLRAPFHGPPCGCLVRRLLPARLQLKHPGPARTSALFDKSLFLIQSIAAFLPLSSLRFYRHFSLLTTHAPPSHLPIPCSSVHVFVPAPHCLHFSLFFLLSYLHSHQYRRTTNPVAVAGTVRKTAPADDIANQDLDQLTSGEPEDKVHATATRHFLSPTSHARLTLPKITH